MSMSSTWLITGASRGIGLELVKQLLISPHVVLFATCRDPQSATSLLALGDCNSINGKLYVVRMDVTDEASIISAKDEVAGILQGRGLDYLINNAGVAPQDDRTTTLNTNDLISTVIVNVAGPALVTRTFIPLIEQGDRKVIANVSSALASISTDWGREHTSYSISKYGLNMLTYKLAKERPDLTPFLLDPGWVKTDMGGSNALLEVHESVTGIIQVVRNVTAKDAGRFIDYTGQIVPW
ncbi:NAD(P)-binding protein [Suillus clintonianus]|uniref:NAD(P)-binding protein n=1 Tax=Suillus clintonianus TaxID=1904413 RepID=UPI001B878F40|nr:NAD(P)-binding protein [Suillus clintonianus]KAG2143073.1 NAD(P)-binding protein [Suillus clintonianus]